MTARLDSRRRQVPFAWVPQVAVLAIALACRPVAVSEGNAEFPVAPEVFIDEFQASEGITFNAQGELFIGANRAVWLAQPDGGVTRLTDVHLHLGQEGGCQRSAASALARNRWLANHAGRPHSTRMKSLLR